jgi:NTE family protein
MKQKISLVLSGGGARGIAHIGVIEELEKQNFEIASVSGTSMGALIGGFYALGKLPEYKDWLLTLDKLKVFNLVDFSFGSQGLIKGEKVLNTIKEFIPDANIEDLKIPYAAVAVDLLNKKEKVFTQGSVYAAIRASMGYPSVFTPVKSENTLLIDGGVLNNIPINHVKRTPGDLLVAVNVNADIPVYKPDNQIEEVEIENSVYRKKIREFEHRLQKISPLNGNNKNEVGYFDLINRTLGVMSEYITQTRLEKYPPDVLINISKASCKVYDFYKAQQQIEIGRYAAQKCLSDIKF